MADWTCPDCGLTLNFSELCNGGGHTCLPNVRAENEKLKKEVSAYDYWHTRWLARTAPEPEDEAPDRVEHIHQRHRKHIMDSYEDALKEKPCES